MKLIVLSLVLLSGCVTFEKYEQGYRYTSFDKNIGAHVKLPDGTEIDLTSTVETQLIRAIAEGVAAGAVKGVKP